MLILTRKLGESIQIGDDIRIKIIDVSRSFVKVGIEAPRDVKVHREEIYERIREENILAGASDQGGLSLAATLLKNKSASKRKPNRIKIRRKPKEEKK